MFSIFYTDEIQTDRFTFRNAFNVKETVYLYGATTIKTDVNRSEAVCGRETLFYDQEVLVTHEVETAPMTYNEAMWLNQLLTARWVARILEDGTEAPILISDISSEVADTDKDLIRIKFNWKYADGNEYLKYLT